MTIGEVSRATGTTAPTIRFYEASGILPKPPRKNGIRRYDSAIVESLRVLKFYRSVGVSIEDLAAMFGNAAANVRSNTRSSSGVSGKSTT